MSATRPHLVALSSAFGIVVALLAIVLASARWIERRSLRAEAPQTFSIKNQGIVLQREAFRRPWLLPLYGSSELVKDVPDKAADFFSRAPTGFEVFPVGKAGTASLIAMEKLAAVGTDLRDRKLAFSISPSWFWAVADNPHHYAGNFSVEQVNELVFSAPLDRPLKRDVARRLLDFPDTVDQSPVLAFALRRLASDSWLDHVGYEIARPLGWLDGAMLRVQDHLHTAEYLIHRVSNPFVWRHHPIAPKWTRLFESADRATAHADIDNAEAEIERVFTTDDTDSAFRLRVKQAREWSDLELLLRTLNALGARPLLLSMPLDGESFDRVGISTAARVEFYDRLEALAARYNFPLVDFRDHDEDRKFLADTHDHLSAAGWLYYDTALDDFFHDRKPLASVPAHVSR